MVRVPPGPFLVIYFTFNLIIVFGGSVRVSRVRVQDYRVSVKF